MSLKVWLPLNGDLHNQGCSNTSVTNTSAIINTAGKIGSCYSFGTAKSYLKFDDMDFMHNFIECSVSLWLKILSWNTSYATYFQFGLGSTPWAHYIFGLLRNSSASTLCFTISNGSSATNAGCLTPTLELNTWYHLTLTYTAGHCKIYVNGIQTNDYSTNIIPNFAGITTGTIGVANNLTGYQTNCLINDFRIYDHTLSAAEVREISQGLVLHYKLDSFQGNYGNPNLYTGSRDFSGTWVNKNNWTTAEETYCGFTVKQKSTTWGGLCQNITCAQNDIFTVSFYAKVDSGGQIMSIHRSSLGNVTTGLNILGGNFSSGTNWITTSQDGTQWKRYWATVQITSADITYLQWRIENNQSGKNLYVCGMKLEKGSSHTDWSPAANEGSFNIIPDSSGYGHNGSINGNITLNNSSIRYDLCIYSADGGSNYIQTPTLTMPTDAITLNIWFRSSNTAPTSDYHMIVDSVGNSSERQHYEICIHKTGYFRGGLYVNGSRKADNCTTTTGCNGQWHMLTMTYDGANVKRYFDGKMEKSTAAAITTGLQPSATLRLLKDGYSTYACKEASLSDFRIYATALSADDIKQLYQVSAKVDNLGGLHTFELNENNTGRELLAIPLTQPYNNHTANYSGYDTNGEITLTGNSSIGSNYIKINPTGHTYYYDIDVSTDNGNVFYIGFERYDVNKTARSNAACVYLSGLAGSSEARTHKHYHGIVNLATDGVNPTDTIALRILNDWSGANGRKATIHKISLREVSTISNSKINKKGQVIVDEFIELDGNCRVQKNGSIEANEFIEL